MKRFKFIHYTLFLTLLLFMAACNTSGPEIPGEPDTATLTVNVEGEGAVTTVVDGQTVTVTDGWSESFEEGSTVVLTATPADPATTEVNWTGCAQVDAATNSCTVALNADTTVSVAFVPVTTEPEPEPGTERLERHIAADEDDAEEFRSATTTPYENPEGFVHLNSSTLDLTYDAGFSTDQVVGLRFTDIGIPQGANITNAYIQFTARGTNASVVAVEITGQAADNAAPFEANLHNLSNRLSDTVGAVSWTPAPWDTVGAAGEAQQTPDLTEIVQQLVNRPGWQAGNAMVFLITNLGEAEARRAVSHDRDPAQAPLLVIEYTTN